MEHALPAWVIANDDQREAFEADRISQSLFAATEAIGLPNAFLARELADGVLHFLALEGLGETVSVEQIAEVTAKVVRELGHPALGRVIEQRRRKPPEPAASAFPGDFAVQLCPEQTPNDFLRACLEQYSLRIVHTRDLASAQAEGLLTIEPLDSPQSFAAMQLDVRSIAIDPFETLELVSAHGIGLVLEGLECAWIGASDAEIAAWLRQMRRAVRAYRCPLDVHLHVTQPPPWARTTAGPLFADGDSGSALDSRTVLDHLARGFEGPLHLYWHVAAQHAIDPALTPWLKSMHESKGWQTALNFDRPKRPIALSRGLNRTHPADLGSVRLHLRALLERPGLREDSGAFLGKLPSLVRMAVSAGVQKRKYLRRASQELSRGFALDRARWRIVPSGLDEVVRHFLKQGLAESRVSLALGREMLDGMRSVLNEEGRRTGLSMALAPDLDASAAELCHPEDTGFVTLSFADSGKIDWLRERTSLECCQLI